jgi:hypothetical protein
MYVTLYNNGLCTIEDISHISKIRNNNWYFYYDITFRSGASLQLGLELGTHYQDGKSYVINKNNEESIEDVDDCREHSSYVKFEKSYNELIEKYKKYHEETK